MARVQYGSIITDMFGSIGGLTYQHNKSGKIVRVKPVPHRKSSVNQQARQTAFTDIIRSWYDLTSTQKYNWNVFANANTKFNVWNEEKTLNGYNWFLSINNYLKMVGETPLVIPPTYATPLAVPTFSIEWDDITNEIAWSPYFAHANEYLLVYMSPFLRSIGLYDRKQLRHVGTVAPGTTASYDWGSDYTSVFGLDPQPLNGDVSLILIVAVLTVHETKGLASVYNIFGEHYSP